MSAAEAAASALWQDPYCCAQGCVTGAWRAGACLCRKRRLPFRCRKHRREILRSRPCGQEFSGIQGISGRPGLERGTRRPGAFRPRATRPCRACPGRKGKDVIGLTETCEIRPLLYMAGGEPVFGEKMTRPCRLEHGSFQGWKTPGAEMWPARARLFTTGDAIPVGSEIACGSDRYVVSVCQEMKGRGCHHLEVMLQ